MIEQIIIAKTETEWPGIKINYHKPVELFLDSFYGYNEKIDSFKILYIKEGEGISHFKKSAIENYKKFDAILTYDEEILQKCSNAHMMLFGTSWVFSYDFPLKNFQISHLVGHKEITEGHILRKKIYYKQNRIKNPIDFYISKFGGVENIFNNKQLNDSKNPLFDSEFHICIENSQQKNWFTEKLIDCFVTKTIPIYWGCPNIENFFNIDGIFIVKNFEDIINVCNGLNKNSYFEKLQAIDQNFDICKKYCTILDRFENVIKEILQTN